jgi:hypothetical protein
MVPLHIHVVVEGFLATCQVRFNIIDQYTCVLTNTAQELTPYRFEFKCGTSKIRKYSLTVPRFEPGSLEQTKDASANSAMLPLP